MPINTGQISSLLRPGLASVFGSYPMYKSQWSEIYQTYDSDKAVEYEIEMKYLGLAQLRPEGAPTSLDTMGQRITTTYQHRYVSLGFVITRQALVDDLYKTKFPMMAVSLRNSLAQTKEILGASILNNGFNVAYPIGDGQPLFSTAHPIDGSTYSNTLAVPADLNEASLESAIILMQQFKDQAGLIVQTQPKKLIVPPQNQFVAERLLSSAFRTNTANNDISAVYNLSSVPEGYRTNQFLTPVNGGNMWVLLSDAPDAFKMYQREAVETDVYTDFSTSNLQASALERYSFGVSNARGAVASHG